MYHSRFTGSHYSAGLRYGMELREKGLQPVAGTEPDRSRMDFAGACMPVYERFYPEILEEIQGMADGLGIGIMDFYFPCIAMLTVRNAPVLRVLTAVRYSLGKTVIFL